MHRTMQQRLPGLPVNKVDRLETAKASVGRALRAAIGRDGLKTYGNKGQLSKVLTGEKVPAYLARIFDNPRARRRFGRALLRGDDKVRERTVIEFFEDDDVVDLT